MTNRTLPIKLESHSSADSPRSLSSWKQPFFVLLVLTATGLSYLHAFDAGFVWDDYEYVVDNSTLRSLDGLRLIWLDPRANSQYYPLVYTTFWLEYQLWQLAPLGYHVDNVLLHAINAMLVWVVLRRLSIEGAWLAALIFALHPVHVESVAWVSERKNLLSGLFYLAAGLSYLRFRDFARERRPRPWRYYVAALVLFGCALLAKSVTASLPAAILLVIYWQTGKLRARDVSLLSPFFAAGIIAGLHTAWLERVHVGADGPIWDFSFLERLLIASRALCHYLAQLLWPSPLIFSYPRWHVDSGQGWQYLYGMALIGGLFMLWRARSVRRGLLVAALFFAGTLFPALGFIDLYPMRFSFVADHFQYLASLGIIVPVAAGLCEARRRLISRRPGLFDGLFRGSIGILLVALASLTFTQTRIYHDEETLWRDTLEKNPESWMSHNNLGRIHGFRGEPELARRHFQRAIDLNSEYYVAETNLAESLTQLGRYAEAVEHLQHVLALDPAYADAHFYMFMALRNLDRLDEAVGHLQEETRLNPSFEAHLRAARLLGESGRPREALLELDLAEVLLPNRAATAIARGNLHTGMGHHQKAALYYYEATVRKPNSAVARNNLGQAFARLGRFAEAQEQFERALQINPNHRRARANLERMRAKQ